MPAGPAPLVLASASPRRRELLGRAGVRFEVDAADLDEGQRAGEPAAEYAQRVADEKALAVAARRPDAWVLAADTVVIVDGDVLGKAGDDAEAARMLARLAGRTHVVTTACALVAPRVAAPRRFAVSTEVEMRRLAPDEIAAYAASGEWRGKAGAYAAQGIAASFITSIRGSYTNVVGLPLSEVLVELRLAGAPGEDFSRGNPA